MTSKKSFLTDSIENFKRRNWVFWIQFLSFFCVYPGVLLLGLNGIKTSYLNPEKSIERMNEFTYVMLNINGWSSMLIAGLAVLAGIQAFSYLHNKQQVNFYHSQPVSRNRRFLVIWFNGIVSFLVSYVVNIILAVAVAGSFGCMSATIAALLPKAILGHFLLFLSVYHVAILAVMLTGHTLVSLIGVIILLFYEWGARALYYAYASLFFDTYGYDESVKMLHTLLSPIITFFTYQFGKNSSIYSLSGGYTYSETMFGMAGLALFFGLISWLLYRVRPSESHGKSIAFSKVKEPLKILLLLLIGTCGGLFIYMVSGDSVALGIAGVVFAVLIGHAVIQLIYEVDFRAIRKSLPSMFVSVILAVFIFIAFRWDVFGYDDKIPDQNKVESVALNLSTNYWDSRRVLPDGTEVNSERYWKTEMEITDLDLVYRLLDSRISFEEHMENVQNSQNQTPDSCVVEVVFKLNNGKTSSRRLYIDYRNNLDVLNEIFHLREYQVNSNQLMEENFAEDFHIFQAEYENGLMYYKVPDKTVKQVLEAYTADMNSVDLADLCNSIPVGRLTVGGIGIQNREFINEWWVTIYPEFTRTTALLAQEGIPVQASINQDYLDRIKTINIIYTDVAAMKADGGIFSSDYQRRIELINEANADLVMAERQENNDTKYPENVTVEADSGQTGSVMVDSAMLEDILDNCTLQVVSGWMNYPNFSETRSIETTYEVIVELKEPDSEYNYNDSYYFLKGQMPEFVKEMIIEKSGVLPEEYSPDMETEVTILTN